MPQKDDAESYIFKRNIHILVNTKKAVETLTWDSFPVLVLNHSFALEDAYADNSSFVY